MPIIENAEHIPGKVCRTCGEWKSLAEYSRRMEHGIPTGDGYQNDCKKCRSAAELKRYRAKGEAGKARLREQYRTHREKRLGAMRVYRAVNREKVLVQKRLHWAATRDSINAERRVRHASNPFRRREADRAYYAVNRDKRQRYSRVYRAEHPDKIHSQNRDYYRQHRGRFYEYVNRRRARKAQAEGSHTEAEWEALKLGYEQTCLCCGKQEPEITLTRDHVIPLDAGGSDNINNIQPLCKSCNSKKSTKSIDYRLGWEQRLTSSDTQGSA
jgi:5-methylcytosine-specific restriction endonuclease McrA